MKPDKLDKKLDEMVERAKNHFKWLAIDEDGYVCVFDNKPTINKRYNLWERVKGNYAFICHTNDKELRKNWNKTLRKIG